MLKFGGKKMETQYSLQMVDGCRRKGGEICTTVRGTKLRP